MPLNLDDAAYVEVGGDPSGEFQSLSSNLANHETSPDGEISFKMASTIQAIPIRWLWPSRIARGKVSMVAGNPGLGKSQVTASMAAIVSTGGRWPADSKKCEPGNVVMFSAEDDPADTIRPRLEAAGADLNRVAIIDPAPVTEMVKNSFQKQRGFSLKEDLPLLDATLTKIGDVALLIIDPITAYLGDADSHVNAEIRALLSPLADLAAKHGTAVVCVSHFNKARGSESVTRIMGSLAFVAAARSAYAVLEDPKDNFRRLFLPIKNNIGADRNGLAFSVEGHEIESSGKKIETSRIAWEAEAIEMTANEVMASADSGDRSATDEAVDFLRTILAEGPMKVRDAQKEARQAGISEKPLRTARERICEKPKQKSDGWWWKLKDSKVPPDAQKTPGAQRSTYKNKASGHLAATEPSKICEGAQDVGEGVWTREI